MRNTTEPASTWTMKILPIKTKCKGLWMLSGNILWICISKFFHRFNYKNQPQITWFVDCSFQPDWLIWLFHKVNKTRIRDLRSTTSAGNWILGTAGIDDGLLEKEINSFKNSIEMELANIDILSYTARTTNLFCLKSLTKYLKYIFTCIKSPKTQTNWMKPRRS